MPLLMAYIGVNPVVLVCSLKGQCVTHFTIVREFHNHEQILSSSIGNYHCLTISNKYCAFIACFTEDTPTIHSVMNVILHIFKKFGLLDDASSRLM